MGGIEAIVKLTQKTLKSSNDVHILINVNFLQ